MQLQAVASSVCIMASATEKKAKEVLVVLRLIVLGLSAVYGHTIDTGV